VRPADQMQQSLHPLLGHLSRPGMCDPAHTKKDRVSRSSSYPS
jgi:hypothetical protein